MGAWKCTGSRILKFNIAVDETECHILSNESEQCSVVKIRRQYHVHGTDSDLHRMIAFVDTAPPATQYVVQYWFESGREHLVPIKAVMHQSTIRTVIYHLTIIHLTIPLMIQQDTPPILPGHLIQQQLFSDLAHCILIVIALVEVLLVLHPTAVPACLSLSSF